MSIKNKVGDKVNEHEGFLAKTKLEKEEFVLYWNIDNFDELEEIYNSPIFVQPPKGQYEWKLSVNPYKTHGDKDYIGIYLHLVKTQDDKKHVPVDYSISLIDSNSKILKTNTFSNSFCPTDGSSWGCRSLLRSEVLDPTKKILVNGITLKIRCQVSFVTGWTDSKFETVSSLAKSDGRKRQKLELMKQIFVDGKFSDVVLKTGKSSFPASKIILAASPVFNAMFTSGMIESQENIVKIEDFSDEIVKGMLEFLYTGQVNLQENNIGEMLKISDKYQIVDLKDKCEEFLQKNLNVENSTDILVLSHFCNLPQLKSRVIVFINRVKTEVEKTEGYEKMSKNHPELFVALYKARQ